MVDTSGWPAPNPGDYGQGAGSPTYEPRPDRPGPGDLNIRQRRSWRTWHLVVVAAVALLLGMIIGNSGGGGASPRSGTSTYRLPPPSGSGPASGGATTTSVPDTATSSPGGAAGGSTTTSSASGSGQAQVIFQSPQTKGNWTSHSFTVASAPWNIGWAYQCTPPPASGPAFQVFVTSAGASPGGQPTVSESAASGQSVTPQSTTGSQVLQVQAPSSCTWIVRVTGVP